MRTAVPAAALALVVSYVIGYNIDLSEPVVRKGRRSGGEGAFFGFSVAQFRDSTSSWMIVGAPRDNATKLSRIGLSHTGSIYRCRVAKDSACEEIEVDTDYVINPQDKMKYGVLENQWLGCSVAAAVNGPIVACAHRYVYAKFDTKHWFPVGRCTVLNNTFSVSYTLHPARDLYPRTDRNQNGVLFSQDGTSAQVSESGDVIAFGSPGAYRWQGILHIIQTDSKLRVTTERNMGANRLSYLGYAIDFVKFGSSDATYIVVGAPRYGNHMHFGRVAVFEYDLDSQTYSLSLTVDGTLYGTYFGHSVAAVDLDGDSYDDLVVGAPLFSDTWYEQGSVYVYMNKKNHFVKTQMLSGRYLGGRFGFAIAKAGDLDGDSFDDVVISAPYGEGGGVIYIYDGSASGINEQPSQIIEAESVNYHMKLRGFGASLSAGMDLDNNTYPDVLVGAYLSERSILLRSKPVADVEGVVTVIPQFVNYPSSRQFNVSVCFHYFGRMLPHHLGIVYNLSVEETRVHAGLLPRATFVEMGTTMINNTVMAVEDVASCENFTLQLHDEIRDKISPIVITVTYWLPPEKTVSSSEGNPNISQSLMPVLRLQPVHTNSSQAYLLKDCGDDIQCIPDLQIVFAKVNVSGGEENRIILGEVSSIIITVAVRNVEENAYNARLIAIFPHELVYKGLAHAEHNLISCQQLRDIHETQVTCHIGNPLQTGRSVEFGIEMSVVELTAAAQEFTVLLKAVSDNPENETTLADNGKKTDAIWTVAQADFGIEGIALPSHLSFDPTNPPVNVSIIPEKEFQIGQHVNHSYYVINSGPTSVSELELVVSWPWKIKNGSYLLYITMMKFSESVQCQTNAVVDPLGLLMSADNNSESNRSSSDSAAVWHFPEEDCRGSLHALCIPIRCQLHYLAANATAEVQIVSRLFERSLFQSKTFELAVTSTASLSTKMPNLTILVGHRKYFDLTTVINRPIPGSSDDNLQIWVIIVVISCTTLILIAVVALLAYFGFFRRSKKEQLNKERKEMDAEGETVRMLSVTKVDCT